MNRRNVIDWKDVEDIKQCKMQCRNKESIYKEADL